MRQCDNTRSRLEIIVFCSIVIPTHNRETILDRTLGSVAQVQLPTDVKVELIVVANACTDCTVAVVEKHATQFPFPIRCVQEPVPGLGVARNRCVREAAGDIVAFLDDDVQLDHEWLVAICEGFRDYPEHGVMSGRVTLWWEAVSRPEWLSPEIEWVLSSNECGNECIEIALPSNVIGANFAIRRTVWDQIGPFRHDLDRIGQSLLGGGEIEFLYRAKWANIRGKYLPRAHILHWVAPKRVTEDYFRNVAFGSGMSRVIMKPKYTPVTYLRALVGFTYLAIRHGTLGLFAAIRKDKSRQMIHMVRRLIGTGGLTALCRRTFGRAA